MPLKPFRQAVLKSAVRLERDIERDTAGRRTAGSGNQIGNKGDVSAGAWLVEAKDTAKPAFRVTLAIWRGVERQAMLKAKEPALVLSLAGRKLVVLDYNTWLSWRNQGA